MAGIDTIVAEQETQTLKIRGKDYQVGVLSAIQVIRLAKFLARVAKNGFTRLQEIKTDGKDIRADVLEILSVFDEKETVDFISILLGEPDQEICSKVTGVELSQVLAVVCEKNDMGILLGNARRAVEAISKGLQAKK